MRSTNPPKTRWNGSKASTLGVLALVVGVMLPQSAFGHAGHGADIPDDFQPGPPVPGAARIVEMLAGHGQVLLSSDQLEEVLRINRLFDEYEMLAEERPDEAESGEAARLRGYAEEKLLTLVQGLAEVLAVDVSDNQVQMDFESVNELSGDSGVMLLRVQHGDGPTRMVMFDVDIETLGEEVPPLPIPYLSGGTTWVFLLVHSVPEGRTRFNVNFQERETDDMPVGETALRELLAIGEWWETESFQLGLITIEAPRSGRFFWSNGHAWGACRIERAENEVNIDLSCSSANLALSTFRLRHLGENSFEPPVQLSPGESLRFTVHAGA